MKKQQIPRADDDCICPLHKKRTAEVCHRCPWWVQIRGKNPQSNEELDRWGCAVQWLPLMLVENSMMQRQTGAAVESFRNEVVKQNDQGLSAVVGLGRMLRNGPGRLLIESDRE